MDDLVNLSKEELIAQIKTLHAHNVQLKNIISKSNDTSKLPTQNRRSFDFTKCNFRHVLLKFLYLGWDYQGYVTQEDTINTVEHHIFEALRKTCLIENRMSSNYHRCGRTDKGVSSFSQVISIDVRSKSSDIKDEINYCKTLNRVLPDNIQFIAWCPVEQNFSARFDCKSRTYKYFFPKGNLDVENMKTAARYLVGSHDFRNFCKMDVNNGVVEFFRSISFVDITDFHKEENDNYSMCVLTIRGNAFLWHQIRCIVSILLLVGEHKEKPEVVLELLDIANNPRKPDYHMASEIPLILYDCDYENVKWIYDEEALNILRKKLRHFWTFTTIKSSMIETMLTDLEKDHVQNDEKINSPSEYLIQGVKTKKYVPVMKRKLCDSLENKLHNSLKRCKRKGMVKE